MDYATFIENTSLLDYLPNGWVISIVPILRRKLFEALGEYAKYFQVIDAKEKYGGLRVYWSWADNDYTDDEIEAFNKLYDTIEDVIAQFEAQADLACPKCGRQFNYICENCKEKLV